jgi:hypothetical protein
MEAQVSFYAGLPEREDAGIDQRYGEKKDGIAFFVKFVCASIFVCLVIIGCIVFVR